MKLTEMSRKVFLACKEKGITLILNWESREEDLMQRVDAGSLGPWLQQDKFQMDFNSYQSLLSMFILFFIKLVN